jgi:arabinogalactan oligomer/maltooligosaccharide transport system permease protein
MSDQAIPTIKAPTEFDLIKKYGFTRWFFQRARGDSPAKRILIHIILIITVIIAVYPVLRIVTVSLRPGIACYPPRWR